MSKLLFLLFLFSVDQVGVRGDLLFEDYQLIDYQVVKQHHFLYVYNHIRTNIEGNYVNHPSDKGGETYGGIARKLHPNWYGWRHIDADKDKYRHKKIEAAEFWVLDFYLTIWVKEGFDNIEDRELALNLFDFRIHSSPKTVQKKVNKVLIELGCDTIILKDQWITRDFNNLPSKEFVLLLKIQRILLFNYLVTKDTSQEVFYQGWISRLENI